MHTEWTDLDLCRFLHRAGLAGYAGGGEPLPPELVQRPGFREFEYVEGLWRYRDSYAGKQRSFGTEVVWYDGVPVWTQSYGGANTAGDLGKQTITFLKLALRAEASPDRFRPRGTPMFTYIDRETSWRWTYSCLWQGDINEFRGEESITLDNNAVFTHWFHGGTFMRI